MMAIAKMMLLDVKMSGKFISKPFENLISPLLQKSRTLRISALAYDFVPILPIALDRLPPYSIKQLMAAGEELIQHLKSYSPGCSITYKLVGNVTDTVGELNIFNRR